MKASLLFSLTWLIASITAYGTYGAWERVLYYNIYLAELDHLGDHNDPGRKMAKTCSPDVDFTKRDGTRTRACSFDAFLRHIEYEYKPEFDPHDATNTAAVRREATNIKNNLWSQARAFTLAEQDNLAWSLQRWQQTSQYVENKIHNDLNDAKPGSNKIAILYEKMAITMVDRAENIEPYRSQSLNAMSWVGQLREQYFNELMLPQLREKVTALGFPSDHVVVTNEQLPPDSRDGGRRPTYEKWDSQGTLEAIRNSNLFDAKTRKAAAKEIIQWTAEYKKTSETAKHHFQNQLAGRLGASAINSRNTDTLLTRCPSRAT